MSELYIYICVNLTLLCWPRVSNVLFWPIFPDSHLQYTSQVTKAVVTPGIKLFHIPTVVM